jgi:MoxR-like ATPase
MQNLTLAELSQKFQQIRSEVSKAVIGQDTVIEALATGVITGGHVLLEGVPGTAKTLMVRALALAMGLKFRRIQFTPDLMPADIIGTRVFNMKESAFEMYFGPVFTDFLLADEVNRTPPKTQSALLESMQERSATIDGTSYEVSPVFTVFATQNPIEYEGTYPLPEAQLDRFMFKVIVGYPTPAQEEKMLMEYDEGRTLGEPETLGISKVMTLGEVMEARKLVRTVKCEPGMLGYIRKIVAATRNDDSVKLGASPRASIALLSSSKALAALRGRDFIVPDDVKFLAHPVLRHRIIFKAEAEIEGMTSDELITRILGRIEVPR